MISCVNERMSLCQVFLVPSLFEGDYLDYFASKVFFSLARFWCTRERLCTNEISVEHGRHVARIQFPTQA